LLPAIKDGLEHFLALMHEYCITEAVQFQFACTGQASGPTVPRGIPDNGATDYVADAARPAAPARACSSLVAASALLTVRGNVNDDTIVSNTTKAASLFADGFISGVLQFRMTALRARNLGEINRRAAAGQRCRT